MIVVYAELSAKNASSAVTRLRRSDFAAVTYAFDLVLANLGIAIAARMPMMATTISSSMRVKPLRSFSMWILEGKGRRRKCRCQGERCPTRQMGAHGADCAQVVPL